MKITATLTLSVALSCSSMAMADTVNSGSESSSQSFSGVNIEGSEAARIAPSVGAPGTMHTAPCIIGHSVGVSVVGFGAGTAGGKLEDNCNTREEAKFLFDVLNQPDSHSRRAAIYHMCATDESLRNTLVAVGACIIKEKNDD